MKKIILLLTLLLSINLFADIYEGINFGFKGGLNLNNVTLINKSFEVKEEEYQFQKHFFIGGILKFNFIYNLSVQIEANFNNKGFIWSSDKFSNLKETFYYVETPLILSFNIWNNISVYSGLFYAKLMNHNSYTNFNN